MIALQVKNLSKSFQEVQALKKVSFEVEAGNILAVLGPSGCGKTTLLRSISGFEQPDSGFISAAGVPLFNSALKINVKAEKRHLGYVPQDGVLFPHLTAAQNIAFGLPKNRQRNRRVAEMLDLVNMSGLGRRMPHELSGGQQQRIALARALAPAPAIILLDEPFSALDAGLRTTLRDEIKATLKEVGTTAIIVTHDQEEALSMADMVAVMYNGRTTQVDDPVSLYKYPVDLVTAEFIGDATLVEGKVVDGCVHCPFGILNTANELCHNCDNATIMIRPEQFIINKMDENPSHPIHGKVYATVISTTFFGHDALVQLKLDDIFGGYTIQVRIIGTVNFEPGEQVSLSIEGAVMAYS